MKFQKGKLFKNVNTRKVYAWLIDSTKDYYALIREAQEKGFQQSIITSDIMISLSEYFLLHQNTTLISIEFFVDDEELQFEITEAIKQLNMNSAYWAALKSKLEFLSRNDSIDIKKIELKGLDGSGYLFTIYVNGVFTVSAEAFDYVSEKLSRFVEGCVR